MARNKQEVKITEVEGGTRYEAPVYWHRNEQSDPLEQLADAAHMWAHERSEREQEDRPSFLDRLRNNTRNR
jgi:hypothetical protein